MTDPPSAPSASSGPRRSGASAVDPDALPELDPVIHAQARLRVVAALSAVREGDQITFPSLQHVLRMTAGNLSVHLRKLEDAGYVRISKTHRGRTPATYVALTRRGRVAFDDYTAAIRLLLDSAETTEEQR